MEYRRDLEELLLDGLPPAERQHVLTVITDLATEQLDWKRAAGPAAGTGERRNHQQSH